MIPHAAFIIPCYNHGRFVADAARSALAQTGAHVSVVIVNDGSTDPETAGQCDACEDLLETSANPDNSLAVIHQDNLGLPAARNRGAAHPTAYHADYLVFLDADDHVDPLFTIKLHNAILEGERADPSARVSHAYCREQLTGLSNTMWRVPEWDPLLLMVTNLHPVTALVKRSAFDAVGGFDESMTRGYEDWDFWLRLASRSFRGVRVREPLFFWRRHARASMVTDASSRHDELYAALVANHREFYHSRMLEVLLLTNSLLRAHDAAWLDEDRRSIPLRDMRAHVEQLITTTRDLVQDRDRAWSTAWNTFHDLKQAEAHAQRSDKLLAERQLEPKPQKRSVLKRFL